jgi:hypothetical protein
VVLDTTDPAVLPKGDVSLTLLPGDERQAGALQRGADLSLQPVLVAAQLLDDSSVVSV